MQQPLDFRFVIPLIQINYRMSATNLTSF